MTVTWSPKKERDKDKRRKRANRGCYVCPYCGNNNRIIKSEEYSRLLRKEQEDLHGCITIMTLGASSFIKTGQVDFYTCKKCGTQWKSKIY